MLKLIISQADPKTEMLSFPKEMIKVTSQEAFSTSVQPKGPLLYIMTVQDPSHYLFCDLVLEIVRNPNEGDTSVVICHFPEISDEEFNSFINEDDTLYGILMIQFQMKILEQLFLFCATHSASSLVIYTDDVENDGLEIYREFLACEDQIHSQNDDHSEIVFPINQQIYGEWMDFMDTVSTKLRQTLWQGQRSNCAIRNYLKTHPLG
jgi:hypothetical protein